MTKQKVWFEKKPEFRDECPFFVYGEHLHYCRLKKISIFDNKDKCTYCPLQSIKTHDRELVKKVCEKISIELENETETYCEIRQCSSPHYQGDYVWFNYVKFRKFIDQIQKEFEK